MIQNSNNNNKQYETIKLSTPLKNVLQVTLSRPKQRNAFTRKMAFELVEVFELVSKVDDIRVVVLAGDIDGKAFCAGADLVEGFATNEERDNNNKLAKRLVTPSLHRDEGGMVSLAIMNCTKPTIAAINGSAVGVGMTIPCACDIRVVLGDAKVGFPFVRRGLACESISSLTLPRLVGLGKAQELVLTGRVFSARDAPQGLFNYVESSNEDVMKRAYQLAQEIVENTSPLSIAFSRSLLLRCNTNTPEEVFLIESKAIASCIMGPDNMEGVRSFLEKRRPQFKSSAWSSLPDWFPFWKRVDVKANL
jgi:enoyl-CoA hydratase/carnithine racemase